MDIQEIKEKTKGIQEAATEILEELEAYPYPPEKERGIRKDLGLED